MLRKQKIYGNDNYSFMLNLKTHGVVVVKEGSSYYVYDPGRIDEIYKKMPLSTYMNLGSENNNYTYSSISLMYYYS